MELVASVLIDGSPDKVFDYRVPEALAGHVVEASRVVVPLRSSRQTGTVLAVRIRETGATAGGFALRDLLAMADEAPLLPTNLMRLARWIAGYYMAPLDQVLRAMAPAAVRPENTREMTRRVVRLVHSPSAEEMDALRKRARRQASILEVLAEARASGIHGVDAAELGGGSATAALSALAGRGWIEVSEENVARDPFDEEGLVATCAMDLSAEQQAAVDAVSAQVAAEKPRPVLLQGVTGSGKTEVYLQSIARVVGDGGGAIILVPEISLTPQTVERFKSRFSPLGVGVAVLHSRMSEGERFDEWTRIRRGQARVVVGPRSAVFAPLERAGLIVVDEEHEQSYKQESAPRYHARDVAVMRAHLEGGAVVLGSATPSLESHANAASGKYLRVRLERRIDDRALPLVRVIDMRIESRKRKDVTILSEPLRQGIERRLEKAEQTILFLNRRGFARSLQCPSCGHVVQCRHCSVGMTYHKTNDRLLCHLCGYSQHTPRQCPSCREPGIHLTGFGTQRVEEVVAKVFPKARLARLDADVTRRKNAMDSMLRDFKRGRIDILIGTQMIAKGLDFPNVTLVGVLSADIGLNLPDFRAGERTFQLLTQVAGRAGRGVLSGEVVVQSFAPHSPSIQFARHHDFDGFAEQEMEFRKAFHYPPYTHAVMAGTRSPSEESARQTLEKLEARLRRDPPSGLRIGRPAPSPLAKMQDQFRYQMLLIAPSALRITRHLQSAMEGFKPPKEVHLHFDVDAYQIS